MKRILAYNCDFSACGKIRTVFPLMYLNCKFAAQGRFQSIISPTLLGDIRLLEIMDTIYFQRQVHPAQVEYIRSLGDLRRNKKLKAALIYDLDDYFQEIPNYNYCYDVYNDFDWNSIFNTVYENVNMVTCSTEYLRM